MIRWIRNILLAVAVALLTVLVIACVRFRGEIDFAVVIFWLIAAPVAVFVCYQLVRWISFVESGRHTWTTMAYVEQAVRMNLPLPRMLLAAEASESFATAVLLRRVRTRLENGDGITETLRRSLPALDPRTTSLLSAAEKTGRIGDEFARVVNENLARRSRNVADAMFLRTYPVAMLIALPCVVFVIMVFVMPKFVQIFRDYGAPLPWPTRLLVQLAGPLDLGFWCVMFVVLVILLRFTLRLRAVRALGLFAWFPRNRNLSDVCHVVSTSLQAGLPLDAALRGAGELSVGRPLKTKLARWVSGVEGGMPSALAADAAGMPRLISAMTATAERTQAAAAFDFLSRYYASRFSRTVALLRGASIPAMTFFFGAVVAFVVLALFLPLITLIDVTMPFKGGL